MITRSGAHASPRRSQPKCDLFIPGHMVHWIQARLVCEHPRESGVLERVRGRVITVRFPDRVTRYRNHRAEAVLDVAHPGSLVTVSERYGLLGIPLENGDVRWFCIVNADKLWRPCSVAPTGPVSFEDLAARVKDRGGFSIPGALLTGTLEHPGTEPAAEPEPTEDPSHSSKCR